MHSGKNCKGTLRVGTTFVLLGPGNLGCLHEFSAQNWPQFCHRWDLVKTVAVRHNGQTLQRMLLNTVPVFLAEIRVSVMQMVALTTGKAVAAGIRARAVEMVALTTGNAMPAYLHLHAVTRKQGHNSKISQKPTTARS